MPEMHLKCLFSLSLCKFLTIIYSLTIQSLKLYQVLTMLCMWLLQCLTFLDDMNSTPKWNNFTFRACKWTAVLGKHECACHPQVGFIHTHTLTHTSYILMGYYLQVGFKHHALWGTPGIITWSCILNHIWQCSWSYLIKTCCYLPKFLQNNVSLHMKNTCWCASLVPCHVDTVGNIAWSKLHHEMYDSSHLIYMYLFLSCPA